MNVLRSLNIREKINHDVAQPNKVKGKSANARAVVVN